MLPGLTVALASAGAWAASSMRWPPASLSSQALLSRRSCTSSSGSWVSFFCTLHLAARGRQNSAHPGAPRPGQGRGLALSTLRCLLQCCTLASALHLLPGPMSSGTPTEESWPGVMSISEFRAYNFPRYLPQPLLSHAPR